MPKFFYVARDNAGKKRISGSEEASTSDEIIARLQSRDLIVINVVAESELSKSNLRLEGTSSLPRRRRRMHSRVSGQDLMLFCRQLTTLLSAGVTILKSLEIIANQVSSRKFYNILMKMIKEMEAGASLHEAMSKHPKVFSDLWVNLVESGEASGNLAIVLNRLASYLERNEAFKKKIISAIIYPVILMIAGTGALLFLTIKIVPTFAEIFKGFNITLPLLTRMLIAVSAFIRKFFLVIIAIAILIAYLFRRYILQTRVGRVKFENFKFKLPVFGEFFRALVVERFSSEMSTLVESGVPILYSLEITEGSVNNLVMAGIIRQIKEDVRGGKSLSYPLEKSGFFEPMVVQMVSIGEEIGELAEMFKKINSFYQEYVETFLTRFTAMFEPLMLLFMGAVIGLMVIGMFLPIFKIAQFAG
ncbi:MAG: type II secretion system F family protein [Candidatus Omnitrophica bacterium]|nr:type II secretion system F family protein [Candidatus Omnitrophota bacterium]